MKSPTKYEPIEKLMDAVSLVPKPGYGPINFHQLQEDLGNAFATIQADTYAVGVWLAHLVDPLERLM